jgi:hypothetical protein
MEIRPRAVTGMKKVPYNTEENFLIVIMNSFFFLWVAFG